jgi:signal transduction histidine kinase
MIIDRFTRRWVVGTAVVVGLLILQASAHLIAGRSSLRMILPVVAVPTIVVASSVTSVWTRRKRFGATRTLLTGLAVAATIGVSCASGLRLAQTHVPALRSLEMPVSYLHCAALGCALGLLACGVWALSFVYPFAAEEALRHDLEADKLRTDAELARLRSQLEPHFLRNTLNMIAGLVTQNPREARRLLASLGDLLGEAVSDGTEMHTVEEEIAWLRRYAELLEARHVGVLIFRWYVTPETHDLLVPRLLLQPLVENAVKHGALDRQEGGEVIIRAALSIDGGEERVVWTIEDNGRGMSDGPSRPGALGLRAVRRRLELRDPRAKLRIESSSSGTRAIVELPCWSQRAVPLH